MAHPWLPATVASGAGSLPGTDPLEAARIVVGELPDLPHVPELPARGPGSDMVGRGALFLTDQHVDLQPSGWRLVDHPGIDSRRGRGLLGHDLDAFEEAAHGFTGTIKTQCAGPLTLAGTLELRHGDKALFDPSAVRDLAGALADGLAAHVAELRRRLPDAQVIVQLDEPLLPAVLRGSVPTASGFGALAPLDEALAVERLGAVVGSIRGADGHAAVHCCAASAPIAVMAGAGAEAIGFDLSLLDRRAAAGQLDAIGLAVEDGVALMVGAVPALPPPQQQQPQPLPRTSELAAPIRELWHTIGLPPSGLATAVIVTPACGLAAAPPSWPREAYRACREIARALAEDPEGS